MLKQLIQRLLDSRTTPSEASHSSYPDDGTVTQFYPSATSVSSWTKVVDSTIAPSDGYVIVRGKATGESYVQITAGDNPPHMERSTFAKTALNQYPILNLPIAKGKTFKVFAENTAEITVGLIKSIGGGGYNNLVRRALSCLRPSFNYLPRSFCKAKNLGFQNNQLLSSIRALISLAQAPRISLVTSLRATAGQLLDATQIQSQLLKSKSRTGRWHLLPFLTETLRELESVVTLKKGHRLSSCVVAEVQPIILFGSTRQVQTFNPLTGGALC